MEPNAENESYVLEEDYENYEPSEQGKYLPLAASPPWFGRCAASFTARLKLPPTRTACKVQFIRPFRHVPPSSFSRFDCLWQRASPPVLSEGGVCSNTAGPIALFALVSIVSTLLPTFLHCSATNSTARLRLRRNRRVCSIPRNGPARGPGLALDCAERAEGAPSEGMACVPDCKDRRNLLLQLSERKEPVGAPLRRNIQAALPKREAAANAGGPGGFEACLRHEIV